MTTSELALLGDQAAATPTTLTLLPAGTPAVADGDEAAGGGSVAPGSAPSDVHRFWAAFNDPHATPWFHVDLYALRIAYRSAGFTEHLPTTVTGPTCLMTGPVDPSTGESVLRVEVPLTRDADDWRARAAVALSLLEENLATPRPDLGMLSNYPFDLHHLLAGLTADPDPAGGPGDDTAGDLGPVQPIALPGPGRLALPPAATRRLPD